MKSPVIAGRQRTADAPSERMQKVADYTEYGDWQASTNECCVYLGWKSAAISTGTGRVRLTAQIQRSDGTYAGTTTVAGYIIPGAMEPCIDIPD